MNIEDMKITEHFTLKEMVASKSHPEVKNVPNEEQVKNLKCLCKWLERLREYYNVAYPSEDGKEQPIVINSGYRSKMLNKAVGGSETSNHLTGCAADIHCKDCVQAVRYATILIDLFQTNKTLWDEIYIERKGTTFWVHFAVRPTKNRCRVSCYDA